MKNKNLAGWNYIGIMIGLLVPGPRKKRKRGITTGFIPRFPLLLPMDVKEPPDFETKSEGGGYLESDILDIIRKIII